MNCDESTSFMCSSFPSVLFPVFLVESAQLSMFSLRGEEDSKSAYGNWRCLSPLLEGNR